MRFCISLDMGGSIKNQKDIAEYLHQIAKNIESQDLLDLQKPNYLYSRTTPAIKIGQYSVLNKCLKRVTHSELVEYINTVCPEG